MCLSEWVVFSQQFVDHCILFDHLSWLSFSSSSYSSCSVRQGSVSRFHVQIPIHNNFCDEDCINPPRPRDQKTHRQVSHSSTDRHSISRINRARLAIDDDDVAAAVLLSVFDCHVRIDPSISAITIIIIFVIALYCNSEATTINWHLSRYWRLSNQPLTRLKNYIISQLTRGEREGTERKN